MAKKKAKPQPKNDPPPFEADVVTPDGPAVLEPGWTAEEAEAYAAAAEEPGVELPESIIIELPLGKWHGGGRTPRTIASQRLVKHHGVALRLLREGLHQSHAQLIGGRHVETDTQAVRYLLEQIVEQLPVETIERISNETT